MKTIRIAAIGVLALAVSLSARTIKPGVERWAVKTSWKSGTTVAAKAIPFATFVALPNVDGVKHNDKRYNAATIPSSMTGTGPAEGSIVSVTGYLKLVALEDDGDYHIQLTATPDAGDTDCIIVEVPNPDPTFVADTAFHPTFAAVREFVKTKLLRGNEPSGTGNVLAHPTLVRVTGQLFYDDAHVGTPPRGKKGMHSKTLWEVHPITRMEFVAKPAIKVAELPGAKAK